MMLMGIEMLVVSGGIVGLLVAWGFRLYIRHGRYTRTPVMVDGDSNGWFEVPWWLRWPVLISFGFVGASVLVFGLMKFFSIDPFTFMSWESGPLSLVLTLALFLAERSPRSLGREARRLIIYGVAVGLGGASAMLIYGLVYKVFNNTG